MKVVGNANEIIGHKPDGLSKVVAPGLKEEIMLSVEAEVNGHPRDAAKRKMDVRRRNRSSMHLQILWSQKEQSRI